MIELLVKDLKVEIRRRFEVVSFTSFVLLSSLMISKAYPTNPFPSLFILVTFLAVFTSTTSFTREMDSKTIYGLKLLPYCPYEIFLEKVIFSFLLIAFQGFLGVFFTSIFGDVNTIEILPVFLTFSFYMATVSSFSSALVMYSEGRAFLTPMIVFIFTLPILIPLLELNVPMMALESLAVFSALISLIPYLLD